MSSCFFSSRLKMRISAMSVSRNRRSTALPNEPVPPVMTRVLPANMLYSNRWCALRASCDDMDLNYRGTCSLREEIKDHEGTWPLVAIVGAAGPPSLARGLPETRMASNASQASTYW